MSTSALPGRTIRPPDESQVLLAVTAPWHSLHRSLASTAFPFVVIPAGTRNHFALDLGLDRTDLPGALKAYEDGIDTTIDLAEVNGRVFVNNVSMGVYARIVQSADYRNAKVQTRPPCCPTSSETPLDLRFTLPSGQEAAGAQLLLVFNNPYELAQLRGGGTREHLNGGMLGIVYLRVESAADAERLAALEVAGQVQRFAAWSEWTAPQFEVRSSGPVEIGIDGEAMILEPPLRFVIRP